MGVKGDEIRKGRRMEERKEDGSKAKGRTGKKDKDGERWRNENVME